MTSRTADAEEQAARRRRDARQLGLLALALVVLLVGGGIAVQRWRTSRAPTPASAGATSSSSSSFAPVPVVSGKPLVLGQSGAKVRLTLYEDFHCPHCADFEEELGSVITAQQEAGHLLVELYPMAFIDAGSATAANAVACAAESGFGQAYYLGLFANHTLQWSDQQLLDLAGKVSPGVPAAFDTCVKTRGRRAWVDSINAAAAANGVTSTPTVLLNGRSLDWSTLTPDSLQTMIDTAARA